MYTVIFEVEPEPERRQDYLELAAQLRPELEKIDGFISIERFESLTTEGKILSLSFWRDDEAVARWRRQQQHREAQLAGRGGIFRDYRLRRVGQLVVDQLHGEVRARRDLDALQVGRAPVDEVGFGGDRVARNRRDGRGRRRCPRRTSGKHDDNGHRDHITQHGCAPQGRPPKS